MKRTKQFRDLPIGTLFAFPGVLDRAFRKTADGEYRLAAEGKGGGKVGDLYVGVEGVVIPLARLPRVAKPRNLAAFLARSHALAFRGLLTQLYGQEDHLTVRQSKGNHLVVGDVGVHLPNLELVKTAFDAGLLAGQSLSPLALEDARSLAADQAWEEYDFEELTVAGENGWEFAQGGNHWHRVFFAENPDGGDSVRHEFDVRFREGSADVDEVTWN